MKPEPRERAARRPASPGRVLHLVTDALPSTSAGYTIRTQEIALAQREAGLDPHVVTRIGFPVTRAASTAAAWSTWTACPTTGCCRGACPAARTRLAGRGLELAAGLTRAAPARRPARGEQLRQRQARARPARAPRPAGGVRGARVLGGHLAVPAPRCRRASHSERYQRNRDAGDAVHAGRGPGGDARRGDAGRDRGPRRPCSPSWSSCPCCSSCGTVPPAGPLAGRAAGGPAGRVRRRRAQRRPAGAAHVSGRAVGPRPAPGRHLALADWRAWLAAPP